MCKLKTNQSENGNPQSQKIEKLSREVPRQQRALSAPPLLYKDYQAIAPQILFTGQDMAEKDYMEAIKQFDLKGLIIGLIPNNVVMGMNELDHTLVYGNNDRVEEQLSMIRKANMLMKKRHIDTSIISVDQSKGFTNENTKIQNEHPSKTFQITPFRKSDHDFSLPITCKIFRQSDSRDESYAVFFNKFVPHIEDIVPSVFNRIKYEELSRIRNQAINLSIFISEDSMQQSVWKKEYIKGRWIHDVIIVLRYNAKFDKNSIAGKSRPDINSKLSPKNVIERIFIQNDEESLGSTADPMLAALFTYYEYILVHELGHVLHAILHPVEFTLLNSVLIKTDVIGKKKYSDDSEAASLIKEWKNKGNIPSNYLQYAQKSTRELIAELFTAMYMGIRIPENVYKWYIDNGGPKMFRFE